LSVTAEPHARMFYCHRASCGFKGVISAAGHGLPNDPPIATKPAFTPNPYPHKLEEVRSEYSRAFWGTNATTVAVVALNWGRKFRAIKDTSYTHYYTRYAPHYHPWLADEDDPDSAEWVSEIYAFDGTFLGHESRIKHKDGRKTVRTWRVVDRPFYHAAFDRAKPAYNALWIVEDRASAERLHAKGAMAMALMGTSTTPGAFKELREAVRRYRVRTVIVALDAGAEKAAWGLRDRLTSILDAVVTVCPLRTDIKDMPDIELNNLILYWDHDEPTAGTTVGSNSEQGGL
jgi:hypothetical protein